jgi:hypothetical protein
MSTPSVEVKKNRFLGTKVEKNVKFMGLDIKIVKLTVAQVMQIQELAQEVSKSEKDADNIKLLTFVIKEGAQELKDLTEQEVYEFPMDELTNLSNEIMQYSGLAQK